MDDIETLVHLCVFKGGLLWQKKTLIGQGFCSGNTEFIVGGSPVNITCHKIRQSRAMGYSLVTMLTHCSPGNKMATLKVRLAQSGNIEANSLGSDLCAKFCIKYCCYFVWKRFTYEI